MFLENCLVTENILVAENYFLLKVKSEKCFDDVKAGQFFMLKCQNEINILRRPISLHYADKKNNILEFYFEVKGNGTREFSRLKKNDTINIQGPLGNGFGTNISGGKVLVIGGGMGIAPTKFLIEELRKKNSVTFIAGGRTKIHTNILKNFSLENIETHIATDDGSEGLKGTVVDVMEKLLPEKKFDRIFTCGPHKMMEFVAKVAQREKIKIEVSLEERMACGVKACVGCSIKTKIGMKKVCHDGPVFDGEIIF
ncbi:MAG: dihydroorotate dehydrogenase electron transfer subunit [Fusobacteriaceae bacterium]